MDLAVCLYIPDGLITKKDLLGCEAVGVLVFPHSAFENGGIYLPGQVAITVEMKPCYEDFRIPDWMNSGVGGAWEIPWWWRGENERVLEEMHGWLGRYVV